MGLYFRKSIRLGPFRLNFSKSGMGVSAGIPGFRAGTGPRGNYIHAGRGGLYYRATLPSTTRPSSAPGPAPEVSVDASVAPMEAIDSGSVLDMTDCSAAGLLAELK